MGIKVTDIVWETDGEDVELPTELEIDTASEGIDDPESQLADWLSDRYGWLVSGFSLESAPGLQQSGFKAG